MEKINASSDEIHKVVKVIDDISFQINLLALNANVEAARAGKYGKGFAVVADEVRNLATKSADSVKETTEMVNETVNNIKQGTEAAEATAEQLNSIVDGSGKVADFLEEIAQASREQAQAIEQITEGLDQIDEATQSNTASAEESASASEELAGQAQQLRSMVAQFSIDERHRGGKQQLTQGSHLEKMSAEGGGSGSARRAQGREASQGEQRSTAAAGGNRGRGTGGNDRRSDRKSAQSGNTQEDEETDSRYETGITPAQPEDKIALDDQDFDRF
jgi:methyl-accepting chemotaxis protein